jgi:hypothetical protein
MLPLFFIVLFVVFFFLYDANRVTDSGFDTHKACGKPLGVLQNAYKNTN